MGDDSGLFIREIEVSEICLNFSDSQLKFCKKKKKGFLIFRALVIFFYFRARHVRLTIMCGSLTRVDF